MSQTKAQLIDAIDGSIVTADIADDAVNADKLASNSVVSASIVDGSIVNADINASAAIAGSKINPVFGNQGITSTNSITLDGSVGDTIIKSSGAEIEFTRASSNNITCSDASGSLVLNTGGSNARMTVAANGQFDFATNVDCNAGLDVSGANLTVDAQIVSTGSILVDDGTNARITITKNSATNARILATTTGFAAYTNLEIRSSTVNFKNAGNTQTLTLDSSGRLLIGTTTEGHDQADNLTIADSANCGLTIRSGSTSAGALFFSDSTSGTGEYDGFITYNQNDRKMSLGTATSTAMTIGSDKRILMGTNSFSNISSNSVLTLSQGSSSATRFNLTNSGSSAMESTQIFSQNNELAFTAGSSGTEKLRIHDDGDVEINDGDLVIGTDGHGIDFSASGGPQGSGSELLDDYEEGSFTPTMAGSSTAGSPTYIFQNGDYTKVGNMVTIIININVSNLGGAAGNMRIGGLPFTPASANEGTTVAQWNQLGSGLPSGTANACPLIQNPNTYVELRCNNNSGGAFSALPVQTVSYLRFVLTYFTV